MHFEYQAVAFKIESKEIKLTVLKLKVGKAQKFAEVHQYVLGEFINCDDCSHKREYRQKARHCSSTAESVRNLPVASTMCWNVCHGR